MATHLSQLQSQHRDTIDDLWTRLLETLPDDFNEAYAQLNECRDLLGLDGPVREVTLGEVMQHRRLLDELLRMGLRELCCRLTERASREVDEVLETN